MALRTRPRAIPKHLYDKLKEDRAPEDILNGLIDACDGKKPDDIDAALDGYCRGKELCGPEVKLEESERLGHVKPEARTVGFVADALGMDPAEVAQLFIGLAGEGTVADNDLAQQWFESEIVTGPGNQILVARRPAWLFRVDDRTGDPFDGDASCLPWRLGLPAWAKTNLRAPPAVQIACVGYRIPAQSVRDAKLPTAIDAGAEGLRYYWKPGGKTVPHSHGPKDCAGGLDEIVAEPPFFREIERKIVRFKSKSS